MPQFRQPTFYEEYHAETEQVIVPLFSLPLAPLEDSFRYQFQQTELVLPLLKLPQKPLPSASLATTVDVISQQREGKQEYQRGFLSTLLLFCFTALAAFFLPGTLWFLFLDFLDTPTDSLSFVLLVTYMAAFSYVLYALIRRYFWRTPTSWKRTYAYGHLEKLETDTMTYLCAVAQERQVRTL